MSKLSEPDIFKWTNCCRLCLSQESTIDLFSEASISQHFPSKIRTCLNFLIYSGDPMPRKICASCCMKLDNWFQFRKECIQTEKDLKRRLEPFKRIAFVKEYFDKYMKYEKSSQDGSISMDSMSEYDENEECEIGVEDVEEEMEICSDSLQKEDENSGLSDNDRLMLLPEYSTFQNKQNLVRNACSENNNQHLKDAPINVDITGKEKETKTETGKSTNNLQEVNIKHKGIDKDKYMSEHSKMFYSTKDMKFPIGKPALGNIEKLHNKVGSAIQKASTNNLKRGNSVDQQNNESVQETSINTCPECGVQFSSEVHMALHNCNAVESGGESDDNDNFINPLSFVDTSLSEPTRDATEGDCVISDVMSDSVCKASDGEGDLENNQVLGTPWKCLVCSENFKSMVDLKQHYSSPDGSCGEADITLECEVCKSTFLTKNEFVEHQLVHMEPQEDVSNGESIKCTGCDCQFESEAQLSQHTCNEDEEHAKVDAGGEYICPKCEQTFHNKELFEKHELIHNQQDMFNSIVTPQFTTFEGIEGIEDYIGDNEEYEDDKKPVNVVRCFRCGRIFNSAQELEQHEFLKHKNPTPYFCRKCDLRFSARSQLLMHVRSHMRKSAPSDHSKSGDITSDNTCAICNAKFFLQSDLQSHLKMHKYSPTEEQLPPPPPPPPPPTPPPQKTWQNPDSYGDNKIDLFARFKCSVCSKIFVHSGSIIRHGKNLHKGQTVYPLRLKRPIFLMKRARSLSLPTEKNVKNPQTSKPLNSDYAAAVGISVNLQQEQEENFEMEINQESRWDQDFEGTKLDSSTEFGTEKCPFCEKVFKPTYLPRHIKRNHRGEVLDPQMLGKDIPDDSLVCRYCLKSCSNPHNRRVHESIHYPVKMQCTQCKICGQKFFNKSSYEIHILGCKSVRCVKCNKIFFRYLSLKNHSCIVTIPTESNA